MKGCVRLLSGLLAAGMLFFSVGYVTAGKTWAGHPANSHVFGPGGMPAEGLVFDRKGRLLADYSGKRKVHDEALRKSTVHWVGDAAGNVQIPAVRMGLKGTGSWDPVNGLYRYGEGSKNVQLTLDGELQKIAAEAMQGRAGVVALYHYRTGEILCAVSGPGYDPDAPEMVDGMYLNRFTQASFVPGSVFKIVTTAAALEAFGSLQDWRYTCTGRAGEVSCPRVHGKQDLQQAMANSCNCAYGALARELGPEKLEYYTKTFRVLEPVTFDGIQTAGGSAVFSRMSEADLAWAAIGQGADLIDPCAFLAFLGAIACDGWSAAPHILPGKPVMQERILSARSAGRLRTLMAGNVTENYGAGSFLGLPVCAKTGTAQLGPGKKPNALLAGFLTDEQMPYAFLVIVEEAGAGKTVCIPIVRALLAALKENPPA